jgi:hypothetical protein
MTKYHNAAGVSEIPREPQPCNFFPPMVRDALVAASQTPIHPRLFPLARILAIDEAVAQARRTHPERFHPEN